MAQQPESEMKVKSLKSLDKERKIFWNSMWIHAIVSTTSAKMKERIF